MSSTPRTAVILDSQPLWLAALEKVLERTGVEVVCKTISAAEALVAVSESQPDLFLAELDDFDDGPDGLDTLRNAREVAPDLRIIALSSNRDVSRVNEALDAGAVAYVVKTAHLDDMASVVRQVFDHSIFIAPAHIVGGATQPRPRRSDDAGLTRREVEILRFVSEGHSNADLAKMLWVTEQTVKFHLGRIYRKLGVKNRTEAGRWAQIHGLLDAPVEAEPFGSFGYPRAIQSRKRSAPQHQTEPVIRAT